MERNCCIYHFSANKCRKNCSSAMEKLYMFAESTGFTVEDTYLDGGLKTGEHNQLKDLLNGNKHYDAVVLRDLYHLNKWTNRMVEIVRQLNEKNCTVVSEKEGAFYLTDGEELFDKPLNIAFYHSHFGERDTRQYETQLEIVRLFCKEKTSWSIKDEFYDQAAKFNVKAQTELDRLIKCASEYDLLIVGSFARIDLRTARFMKLRAELGLDIFSLQQGLIYKNKGE